MTGNVAPIYPMKSILEVHSEGTQRPEETPALPLPPAKETVKVLEKAVRGSRIAHTGTDERTSAGDRNSGDFGTMHPSPGRRRSADPRAIDQRLTKWTRNGPGGELA